MEIYGHCDLCNKPIGLNELYGSVDLSRESCSKDYVVTVVEAEQKLIFCDKCRSWAFENLQVLLKGKPSDIANLKDIDIELIGYN